MKNKNTKPIKCALEWCNNTQYKKSYGKFDRFCGSHRYKATIDRFLSNIYTRMLQRVRGLNTRNPHLFKGKPILEREFFKMWSKNHPEFLILYKQWVISEFNNKLTPSVNRLDSSRGYTIDNMEWVTFSQNCTMATAVNRMKAKKTIYKLLGVKTNV